MDEDEDIFKLDDFPIGLADKNLKNIATIGKDIDTSKLLEPDHPLLQRFQELLKEHLLKQINRITSDVDELETGIKKKNLEREEIGVETYETQQLINKQQKAIDNYVQELVTLSASREELDNRLQENNSNFKRQKNELEELEKKEMELRNEVESTDMMIKQLSKWEEDIESDLLVNKRISEKTRKDKIQAATEKKKQDMLLYKLTNEIWRLEKQLETLTLQMKIKEDEREKYAESVMLANIDIETHENENKCLLQGWQSLIITIGSRDKYYNSLMETERELNDALETLDFEIDQVKKLANKTLVKHETLTIFKNRIVADIKISEKGLHVELEKKAAFERAMAKYEALEEQLKKDAARVQEEINVVQEQFDTLNKEYEKINEEKYRVEEEILLVLRQEFSQSHTASNLNKLLMEKRDLNRELKIKISQRENKNSTIMSEIQTLEFEISEAERILDELKKEADVESAKLTNCEQEYEKCQKEISKNSRVYELLKKRMEKYDQEDSSSILSPLLFKVKSLERQISETQEKNKELQKNWLREQAIVVDLVEKRQNQIQDINLLKKQITILQQKNLKVSDQIEFYKNQEANMNRNINSLQTKLSGLTASLYKSKDDKEELHSSNALELASLSMSLEECEFESLKLKAEIGDIEEDKVLLSKELIEKNREVLCWEKKIKMAIEAKENIVKEQGEEGEIGRMKAEIHRMNIRYGQLKKVQEKLMVDLEHCITRRDSIVNLAEARVKNMKDGSHKVRIGFQKHIEDMEKKLIQIRADRENLEKKKSQKALDKERMEGEIKTAEEDIIKLENEIVEVRNTIQEKLIDKQFNLDMLVYKQRKIKVYVELARGRFPFTIYKTDSALNLAYDREKDLNSKLRIIVENLLTDFPAHTFLLTKVHNSLVLSIMKI